MKVWNISSIINVLMNSLSLHQILTNHMKIICWYVQFLIFQANIFKQNLKSINIRVARDTLLHMSRLETHYYKCPGQRHTAIHFQARDTLLHMSRPHKIQAVRWWKGAGRGWQDNGVIKIDCIKIRLKMLPETMYCILRITTTLYTCTYLM